MASWLKDYLFIATKQFDLQPATGQVEEQLSNDSVADCAQPAVTDHVTYTPPPRAYY